MVLQPIFGIRVLKASHLGQFSGQKPGTVTSIKKELQSNIDKLWKDCGLTFFYDFRENDEVVKKFWFKHHFTVSN